MAYETSLIGSLAELDQFLPSWREFHASRVQGGRYSQDPAFVRIFASLHGRQQSLRIVVIRHNGEICCVAPFYLATEPLSLRVNLLKLTSVPLRRLKLLGNRLVCSPEADLQECHHQVFRQIARLRRQFDVVEVDGTSPEEFLGKFLDDLDPPTTGLRNMRFARPQVGCGIRLETSLDDYLKSVDRSKLMQKRRKLWKSVNGKTEVVKVTHPDDVPRLLDAVEALYSHTWQGKLYGPRRRNSPDEVSYFQEIARLGWLRSYLLICNGEPVVYWLGTQYRDVFYFDETGFDPQWAKLGPGGVMVFLIVEDLFTHDPPKFADFGLGDHEYKRIVSNSRTTGVDIVFLTSGPAIYPRFVLGTLKVLEWIEAVAKAVVRGLKLDRQARKLLRPEAPQKIPLGG